MSGGPCHTGDVTVGTRNMLEVNGVKVTMRGKIQLHVVDDVEGSA